MMNTDHAENRFDQMKGKLKETWGKLSDNDLLLYKGQREQFLGKLKEYYSLTKEDAEKKLKTMEEACTPKSTSAAPHTGGDGQSASKSPSAQ